MSSTGLLKKRPGPVVTSGVFPHTDAFSFCFLNALTHFCPGAATSVFLLHPQEPNFSTKKERERRFSGRTEKSMIRESPPKNPGRVVTSRVFPHTDAFSFFSATRSPTFARGWGGAFKGLSFCCIPENQTFAHKKEREKKEVRKPRLLWRFFPPKPPTLSPEFFFSYSYPFPKNPVTLSSLPPPGLPPTRSPAFARGWRLRVSVSPRTGLLHQKRFQADVRNPLRFCGVSPPLPDPSFFLLLHLPQKPVDETLSSLLPPRPL